MNDIVASTTDKTTGPVPLLAFTDEERELIASLTTEELADAVNAAQEAARAAVQRIRQSRIAENNLSRPPKPDAACTLSWCTADRDLHAWGEDGSIGWARAHCRKIGRDVELYAAEYVRRTADGAIERKLTDVDADVAIDGHPGAQELRDLATQFTQAADAIESIATDSGRSR